MIMDAALHDRKAFPAIVEQRCNAGKKKRVVSRRLVAKANVV